MIDNIEIDIIAGSGGNGSAHFRREKFVPRGGPDGGDGGHGGSIYFKVNDQLTTLQDVSYKRHYKADRGMHGKGSDKHGKNGKN